MDKRFLGLEIRKMCKEIRCAIYTRKSTQDGLEQAFNSIESQRSECEKFFEMSKQEGWILLPKRYDDGGFSGGNLDRPGLRELFYDIEMGKVNYVIVFKLNRLTRSLVDFIRVISDRFNKNQVRFRSVMEPYLNEESTDNEFMLYLNLGIAQRERKAVRDHVRIKIEGSKKRGMWMGGTVPLGFDAKDKKLIINGEEARVIEHIFKRFTELKSIARLTEELNSQGYRTKEYLSKSGNIYGGKLFRKAAVRWMITNPIYKGKIRHKDKLYAGEHKAIVEEDLWNKAQTLIKNRPHHEAKYEEVLLKGIIRCQICNVSMTPTYTKKKNKLYRYYVCDNHVKGKRCPSINKAVTAGEVERVVIEKMRYINSMKGSKKLDAIWENLFPIKQQEIIRKLIKTVWVADDGIELCVGSEELEDIRNEYGANMEIKEGNASNIQLKERNGEISLFVRCKLKRAAGRCMILVPEEEESYTKTDNTLLKALVNAHLWQRQLNKGKYANLKELGNENKKARFPHRILRLNLLAPKIKEDILNGTQPRHLKLMDFRKNKIPLLWEEQIRVFYGQ